MSEEIKNHKNELGEMQMALNCHSGIYSTMQAGISANHMNCVSRRGSTGLGLIQ